MEKRVIFRPALLAAALFILQCGQGQVTIEQNWPANPGFDYVGWDNTTNVPLMIRHDNNQQIQFFTNNIRRMQLLPSETYTIGGFTGQSKSGSLLLARDVANFYGGGAPGPYSRLHLADTPNGTQQNGYRSNMQNGVTMTGNNDQMYVGQLYNGLDYTDAAIVWSDNPGEWLADRLTFNFTSGYNSAATGGSTSFRGLQTLLIQPDASGDEAYVGLGEFDAAGEAPSERLDVLNGRTRLRELPDAPGEATGTYKVMVVDNAALPSGERGVVKWVDPSVIAAAGCEWTMNTGSDNNLSTAFGTADPNCPDNSDAVGIGIDLAGTTPNAKVTIQSTTFGEALHVVNSTSGSGFIIGGGFAANAPGTGSLSSSGTRGIAAASSGAGPSAVGRAGDFISYDNSFYTNGVHAQTLAGTGEAAAVYGWCRSSAATNVGVYGRVDGAGASDWAGYFAGNVNATGTGYYVGGVFVASDESLKTNIEPLGSPLQVIEQLRPKQYSFIASPHQDVNFPEGQQAGFLAQELESVVPALVRNTRLAPAVDTAGNVLSPAIDYKAVNYAGLVPYLVGALQEMSERQHALVEEVAQMRDQLAACCANPDGSHLQAPTNTTEPALDDRTDDRKLRIVPNPFNESTTVFYTLERGGRTQLMANSADGRELRVLQEANQAAGDYQFQWNTASLAPGMYYVTLLLDGQPVVKKGVKVAR